MCGATVEVVDYLVMLHSLLLSGAAHAATSRCLILGSWCVLPELTAELLVLVLVDACDHETLVAYDHRDVLAMKSLLRTERLNTYAARFCAFRLRCAGVKGSFSSDVALLRRLWYSRSSSTLNSTVGEVGCP